MADIFDSFNKTKDFLVCVDSDGCVMDTMDIKHIDCFGPCMIRQWDLSQWEAEILDRWNVINLYSMTRGINRFKGLAIALGEINKKCTAIDDIEVLQNWVKNSKELSNSALEKTIALTHSDALTKALNWSIDVNTAIINLPESKKLSFMGALEGLDAAHTFADVAVVSSANYEAVLEEWEKHNLLQHVDILLAQNSGSKAYCISQLIEKGYKSENVLMVGDAPGDLDASNENAVNFFPILVKKEATSWKEFATMALQNLKDGNYAEYGKNKKQEFLENLTSK